MFRPSLTVFRFADNPRILVLDFASLHEQGKMLNRVAAFVEKAGLPHDRVLTDGELEPAIRAQGDTVETFYYRSRLCRGIAGGAFSRWPTASRSN